VHGAAGGVGSIATQLARRDGATVLAVVRTDGQLARAQAIGAQHAFRDDDPARPDASVR
jgi:NADPH:quinone reductase